jgi:hypothetical protein
LFVLSSTPFSSLCIAMEPIIPLPIASPPRERQIYPMRQGPPSITAERKKAMAAKRARVQEATTLLCDHGLPPRPPGLSLMLAVFAQAHPNVSDAVSVPLDMAMQNAYTITLQRRKESIRTVRDAIDRLHREGNLNVADRVKAAWDMLNPSTNHVHTTHNEDQQDAGR